MEISSVVEYKEYSEIAYHGNKKKNIDKFLREDEFDLSIAGDNWLGVGVYFFEEDIKQAIDWCEKARKYKHWSIIQALIASDKIIDFTNSTKNYNKFIEVVKKVQEKDKVLEKLKKWYEDKYDVIVKDDFINPLILDLMHFHEPYDLVRHTFRVKGRNKVYGTNLRAMQVQICVKEQSCIIEFEEVNRDEIWKLCR